MKTRYALLLLWMICAAGCVRVPPYRRELLAHPTMLLTDRKSVV